MIAADVLARAADHRRDYNEAKPFRHAMIENFLEPSVAEGLLADFPHFDPKKAINEHGEVGRKAVVETVSSISPGYKAFYRYINSKPFLDAMSALTGIPDLIADETLFGGGTHENLDGQSLDMHVEFNIDERRMLHRRVNLLVYLNHEWREEWGGSIELHSDPWHPEANRTRAFLPLFNRAVIFETNEYSWHGFKRIALPKDRKHLSRKSFSIYLYTKDRPADEVVAPHTTFYVPDPLPAHIGAGVTLSEADAQAIRVAMASREGLIRMYQKLLVEKEDRLRDLLRIRREEIDNDNVGEYAAILKSRSWRLIMRVHRLRHRLRTLGRRSGLTR